VSITTENAKSDPTASAPAPAPLLDDGDTARGLVRLGIGLAVLVGGSVALGIGRTVAVIAAILTMIMLHELGHFLMARRAGMRVTEFFLGFGPKVWSVRRGDTEFGIRAIPAGGYVRVIGMNNLEQIDPADEPFTYRSKSYWQRVRFASAGSAVHFMIAFVLLVVVLAGLGRVENSTPPSTTIAAVSGPADFNGAPSPAAAAGLTRWGPSTAKRSRRGRNPPGSSAPTRGRASP